MKICLQDGVIMKCPRCRRELVSETVQGEKIDACMSCRGLWLHRHQLNRLLPESGGDVELCSVDSRYPVSGPNEIICRECENVKMKKVNFLEYSDIVMDYCPQCGSFWLDRKELGKMHGYLKKIEEGSHSISNFSAHEILVKFSEIAYSIFK
jgi:Zn-finger nucleic acid-binding protein